MKNKYSIIFLICFFFNSPSISAPFSFETTKIDIIDQGNVINAKDGKAISEDKNFEIEAEEFKYYKDLDTLKAYNGIAFIKSDNLEIKFNEIELDQKKLILTAKNNIKIFDNKKKGLGGAISLGIEEASGDYIVIYMADMSDDINDLKEYFDTCKNNVNIDAVFGSRFIKNSQISNYPKKKLFFNRIFNNFVKIVFLSNYNDFTNAFKIYKKKTLLNLKPIVSENFNVFLELPLKIISRKYYYKIIPIKWDNRKKGKAKFKIKELGSMYVFTLIYCWIEKILLNKKI